MTSANRRVGRAHRSSHVLRIGGHGPPYGSHDPDDFGDPMMQPNELEQLLQRADQAADVDIASPATLANRARHRVRRQKQVRAAVGTSVVIALMVFVLNVATRNQSVNIDQPQIAEIQNAPPSAVIDLEARIKALREEADRLESIVRANRLNSKEGMQTVSYDSQSSPMHRSTPMPIPVPLLIEQEAEITARVMVEQANRWINQANRRGDAIRTFERTIKLFPTSAAAIIARTRLSEIKNQSGATI